MKMVQQYPISIISSFSLFSPSLTWVLLILISIVYHQTSINKDKNFQNTLQNVITQSYAGTTGVYVDESPQIHYIRKSDNEQYSKKTTDFSLLLDNSYSFLQNHQQFLISYENSLTPSMYIYNKRAIEDNYRIMKVEQDKSTICYQCQTSVLKIKDNYEQSGPEVKSFIWRQEEQSNIDSMTDPRCRQQQTLIKDTKSFLKQPTQDELNEYPEAINNVQRPQDYTEDQLIFNMEKDQYNQFGIEVNPLDDRLNETSIDKLQLSHIDNSSCICNSTIYNGLLLIFSTVSVIAIVFGTSSTETDNYIQVNYILMIGYILNQSFGSVLSQFSKQIPPFTQIIYVNVSILPLVIWLTASTSDNDDQRQINHIEMPIYGDNYQLTQGSNIWYLCIVIVILVAQTSQLLATYIKINFFQKHSADYQVKLLYVPIIIKILIDILLKGIRFSLIQQLGLIGVTLIGIVQLGELVIQEIQTSKIQLKDDDYIEV